MSTPVLEKKLDRAFEQENSSVRTALAVRSTQGAAATERPRAEVPGVNGIQIHRQWPRHAKSKRISSEVGGEGGSNLPRVYAVQPNSKMM